MQAQDSTGREWESVRHGAGAWPRAVATAPTRRKPVGQILVERGDLASGDLARAVALQQREDARFGDILLAQGMVTSEALHAALAEQYGTEVAALAAEPPDVRLVDALGADFCIRHSVLPWKRAGAATVVICSRPDEFARIAPHLTERFGRVRLAIAPEADIQSALIATRHRALAQRAETRVAAHESCRSWQTGPAWRYVVAMLTAIAALALASPVAAFALLTIWAVLTLSVNSALKLTAAVLYMRRRSRVERASHEDIAGGPGFLRLPTVSILVPLFQEREIAGRLVQRLAALDYPRELLDICLVVEADDRLTQDTLARSDLPRWMRQITVPGGAVRTKPRALNFALDFVRGSIVGVYDAEDAPEPGQIHKVVRRFAERGPSVACLQGVLDFYNPRENWLARAFTIEYATWFRIILPGYERMGFAVPLGGTTLFFRRSALEELGGWDAHNVTEDADLGIRLARHGYRTEFIETVTKEEANCRALPWIKQRSRWIKGYAMTWAVHMRRPRRLLAEIGLRKFLGVQILFLGTLSQFLLAPILWSFWALPLGLPHPLVNAMPPAMFWVLAGVFASSEILTIAVGVLAVSQGEHRFLMKWVPSLHVYWPLATFAAIKGVSEILTKPFYWDKTRHGHLHRDHDIWAVRRPPLLRRNRA
ncbi:glycosyltransferase family 2 protein [Sinisalibacter aestuarii]|uniref:Glycosyl transferase n=1 Tax=Sinisalibacter aestuarii TaxID=2949426 RepID=A0ABQ5LQD7_9RHOB|nr:glycosyltransferase family 2 protein [Sinisalibacter aestuarii]GKY87222.1 glycosyl transferase [Sinisalibacter aestuarii]